MAHGPHWFIGPLVLALVVFGPPLVYALLRSRPAA